VPIFGSGGIAGVFDVDSPVIARFTSDDRRGIERLARAFEARANIVR